MNDSLTSIPLWLSVWLMSLCEKTHMQLPLVGSAEASEENQNRSKSNEPRDGTESSDANYSREYYAKNRERMREYRRKRYHENPERQKANSERWKAKNLERVLNKARLSQRDRISRLTPEEKTARNLKNNRRALELHPNLRREQYEKSYGNPVSRKKILVACKEYRKKNRDKISAYQVRWITEKRRTDPHFKMIQDLRLRAHAALRGQLKQSSTTALLGCDKNTALQFIEAQFQPGMTWNNRGRRPGCWVIDHRIPIAAHDLSTLEGRTAAFHYTNLQPLWFEENLKKSSWHDGKLWSRKDHELPACPPVVEAAQSPA